MDGYPSDGSVSNIRKYNNESSLHVFHACRHCILRNGTCLSHCCQICCRYCNDTQQTQFHTFHTHLTPSARGCIRCILSLLSYVYSFDELTMDSWWQNGPRRDIFYTHKIVGNQDIWTYSASCNASMRIYYLDLGYFRSID